MQTICEANSSRQPCGKLIFCEPEANKGHRACTIPIVFVQKTDKFLFAAKVCEPFADSACSQFCLHIYAFGLHLCTSFYITDRLKIRGIRQVSRHCLSRIEYLVLSLDKIILVMYLVSAQEEFYRMFGEFFKIFIF